MDLKKNYVGNMFNTELLNLEHGKLYGLLIKLFNKKKDWID